MQKPLVKFQVQDCNGKKLTDAQIQAIFGHNPGWWPTWEAWRISKNRKVTDDAWDIGKGKPYTDDTYSMVNSKINQSGCVTPHGSRGTITWFGSVDFYEGLTLPKSFTFGGDPGAKTQEGDA